MKTKKEKTKMASKTQKTKKEKTFQTDAKGNPIACLVPVCKDKITGKARQAYSHGLCATHYQSAAKAIKASQERFKAGKITKPISWDRLEEAGKALPASRRSGAVNWFTEGLED